MPEIANVMLAILLLIVSLAFYSQASALFGQSKCVTPAKPSSFKSLVARTAVPASKVAAVAAALLLNMAGVQAAVDCQSDCFKNCALAAPGSRDYCVSTCEDYCADPERQDGLSGSKDGSRGETGLFGGSIDATTIEDRPPQGPTFIDPALATKYGISPQRVSSTSRHL